MTDKQTRIVEILQEARDRLTDYRDVQLSRGLQFSSSIKTIDKSLDNISKELSKLQNRSVN